MAKVLRSVAMVGLVATLGAWSSVSYATPGGAGGVSQPNPQQTNGEGEASAQAHMTEHERLVATGPVLITEDVDPHALVGDFDGDGAPDKVVTGEDRARIGDGVLTCWADFALSSLGGGVKRSALDVVFEGNPDYQSCSRRHAVTDFNGDQVQELYAYSFYQEPNNAVVYSPEGQKLYHSDEGLPLKGAHTIVFDDLNADGKTDLVVGEGSPHRNGQMRVYLTGESGEPLWDNLVHAANASELEVVDIDPITVGKEVVYESINRMRQGEKELLLTTLEVFYPISKDTRPLRTGPRYVDDDIKLESGTLPGGGGALAVTWRNRHDPDLGPITEVLKMGPDRTLVRTEEIPAPVARNDRVVLLNGDHLSGCVPVLGNDDNTLGATIVITSEPTKGTASVSERDGSACISYNWTGDEVGDDELRYKLVSPTGESQEAYLRLHIEGGPVQTPIAHDDEATLDYTEGPSTCVAVTANDEYADRATVDLLGYAERGVAWVETNDDGNACIYYERTSPGVLQDVIRYSLSYAGRYSEPAELTVTVVNAPPAPSATADVIEWPYDQAMPDCLPVLANDDAPGHSFLTVSERPPHGSASVQTTVGADPQPCIQYQPSSVTVAEDHFAYEVSNITGISEAFITVVRTGDKPAPPGGAAPDEYTARSGMIAEYCPAENDTPNGPVDIEIVSDRGPGVLYRAGNNGCIRFRAPEVESETVSEFTYRLRNAGGTSGVASLRFIVQPENWGPHRKPAPIAVRDRVVMNYQENLRGCIPVLVNDKHVVDENGDATPDVKLELVTTPTAGWAGLNGSCIDYRRLPGAVGDDSFTYRVHTYAGSSEEVVVRIIMRGTPPAGGDTVAF